MIGRPESPPVSRKKYQILYDDIMEILGQITPSMSIQLTGSTCRGLTQIYNGGVGN
jgi:hypothetical protein